jgi:hypothetical protein
MCGRYVNPATAEAERHYAVQLIRWQFDRGYDVASRHLKTDLQ